MIRVKLVKTNTNKPTEGILYWYDGYKTQVAQFEQFDEVSRKWIPVQIQDEEFLK